MKKLLPMSVPWEISPSTPFLSLYSNEEGQHVIQFAGLFGFEESRKEASGTSIDVVKRPLQVDPNRKSGRYQLISLYFTNAWWIKCSPQHSDRETIDESQYDWSNVDGVKRAEEDIDAWLVRTMESWTTTHICPNPGAYIIENSDWDVGHPHSKLGLKHYIILGDRSFIEILAQDCNWVSEGAILGW